MRLIHKGLILVGVPLLVAVIVIGSMFGLIVHNDHLRLEEAKQKRLEEISSQTYVLWYDMLICTVHVIGDKDFALKQQIKQDALQTKDLHDEALELNPNFDRDPNAAKLTGFIDTIRSQIQTMIAGVRHGGFNFGLLVELQKMRKDIATTLWGFSRAEHESIERTLNYLQSRDAQEHTAFRLAALVCGLGIIASLGAAIAFGRWFLKDIAERLQLITDNTIRLGKGLPLNRPLLGSDEIASLDRGFHVMAQALRQVMDKEHALFENASDLMCILDEQLRFAAVNPASKRILGYAAEAMLGLELRSFVAEEDAAGTYDVVASLRNGEPSGTIENRVKHQDGRVLDLRWSMYWSELDRSLYAVAHDISARRALERLKEEFLAMVSHDLRSPLTSIYGSFKLVAAGAFGKVPPLAEEKVAGVAANASRLITLVNDLLDVEKLEAGQVQLQKEFVDVGALLSRAVAEMEPLTRDKRIIVEVECSGAQFSVDADRIMQVLVNLLANAIKFAPDGGHVKLTAEVGASGLQVQVIDDGRGVPENLRQAIFERFKQVEAADGKRKAGTGLGLPICKRIIEEHGGTIGVHARAGQGSNFWFTIPSQAAPPSAQETRQPSSGAAAVSPEAALSPQPAPRQKESLFARLRLTRKGAILIVVPLIFELIFTGSIFALYTNAYQEKERELHQLIVATHARDLMIESGGVGLAVTLEPDAAVKAFRMVSRELLDGEAALRSLTQSDPPEERAAVKELSEASVPLNDLIQQANQQFSVKDFDKVFGGRDRMMTTFGNRLTSASQAVIDLANATGSQTPAKLQQLRRQQGLVLLAGLAASLAICGLSAMLFSTGIARRLRIAEDNVQRLDQDRPLNPPLPGSDEVAHLDHLFHTMVAALNEARHKERAVFDNAQDVMCVVDADGTITSVNPACERQWDYRRAELIGKNLFALIEPGAADAARLALRSVLEGAAPADVETIVKRLDGTTCETLLSLSASLDKRSAIAIAHDINERKEMERLKQEFLAMVSHDMRTPLSSISSTSEMLTLGVFGQLPDKVQQLLQSVVRNCERLLALINDLLDIEKLESGQMQLVLKPVAAKEILQRSADSLDAIIQQRGIKLAVSADERLIVEGDGDRLVQVGVNLLANAIKFSADNAAIDLQAVSNGPFVEFRVRDQGRGIPESHRDTIFERFRQVERADGKREAGTGLGLPICKQIVEMHQGTIGVESKVGAGSTFYFRIPAADNKGQLESAAPSGVQLER